MVDDPWANAPRFCSGCGRALVRRRAQAGFDIQTGEPTYRYEALCPAPWWSRVFAYHPKWYADIWVSDHSVHWTEGYI